MWSDSDCYDSDVSNGEPYLTLKEEVRKGDYFAIKALLEAGSNPNDRDDDNYTLLHWAAGMTDRDNLCEVDAVSSSHYSMRLRREIVHLLLDKGAIAWRIWWQRQFCGDHTGQRVWDLTAHKATVDRLKKACVNQVLSMIRGGSLDRSDAREAKHSGLVAAASLNMVDEMLEIYRAGVDIDDDTCDVTALSEAAEEGCFDTLKALVEDCNARINYDIDQRGTTALWVACLGRNNEIVKYLLDRGGNPFAEKEGMGPVTIWIKHVTIHETVLKHMTEMIEQEASGISERQAEKLYHIFVTSGHHDGIYSLLNAEKKPPPESLQTAAAFGQVETLELLLAEGAYASRLPT